MAKRFLSSSDANALSTRLVAEGYSALRIEDQVLDEYWVSAKTGITSGIDAILNGLPYINKVLLSIQTDGTVNFVNNACEAVDGAYVIEAEIKGNSATPVAKNLQFDL